MKYCTLLLITSFIASQTFAQCYLANQCINDALSSNEEIRLSAYKSSAGSSASIRQGPNQQGVGRSSQVLCLGSYSCNAISSIISQQDISCGGARSCADISDTSSNITVKPSATGDVWFGGIQCRGSESCAYSNMQANDIMCAADLSCAHSNIEASGSIVGRGAYSLYEAIIDSKDSPNNEMNVRLIGYHAGFGATIIHNLLYSINNKT